ncbi:uncharacterized protein Tco025E_01896 [Trypanosoma conorhini]|uniref:START domain-containing protein n=1 Tax=Trypanosoma conorhini TaxID=83891 RepID=A0A3R7N5S0_9TRYP|nr:uncharacterized protein Tco025E_01896 [Trypanosoma conorhini]RNF25853.1 hypothetical protein Tco025E_01896 [Trypanosoma conorhini]
MTILSRPTPSRSHRSWKVTVGSLEERLCVQQRTEEGLKKNKRLAHRLFYRGTDLAQFRIIYSSNPLDYAADAARQHAAQKEANTSPRVVLAVADDPQEIMRDWETLAFLWKKRAALNTSDLLTADSWNRLRGCIADVPVPAGAPTVGIGPKADAERGMLRGGSCCFPSSSSPSRASAEEEVSSREPRRQEEAKLDAYDVFLTRFMRLWHWRYPSGTFLYLLLLALASRCGTMQFPVFCIMTLLAGLTYPLGAMTDEELAEGGQMLSRLETLLGWRSPRQVVTALITLVVVEHVVELLFPQWRFLDALERVLLPLLAASLLYSGASHVAASVSPQTPLAAITDHALEAPASLAEQTVVDGESGEKQFVMDGHLDARPPALDACGKALRDELTPEGPFSAIITRCIEFASVSNGWVVRERRRSGVVVLEKQSPYSKKSAVLFIANIPHANVGTLQHVLLDDPEFKDAKNSYAYQYDKLLAQRASVAALGINEILVLTRYKSSHWGVACREVLNWVSCANLFTPAQQEALGLRRDDGNGLLAFAQCGVACADDAVALPPAMASESHERAAAHIYLIMGLEEADGSLTLHVCHDVDPKGRLPDRFHSFANKQHVAKSEAIMALLGRIGPKPNIVRPYVNARDFDPIIRHAPSCDNATPNGDAEACEHAREPALEKTMPDPEVERIARRFVQELLLREWKLHSEKKGTSLWTTTTPWSDRKAMRTISFVPGVTLGDVEAVVKDLSLAAKLDKSIENKVIVEKVSDAVTLYRTTFHAPMWGVAARDVVTREAAAYYPDLAECEALGLPLTSGVSEGSVLLCAGEDATEELPTTPNYCRGRVFLFGVLAEEVEGEPGVRGVRLVRCAAADPGGSIPNIVVDAALVMQLENAARLSACVKQHASARRNGS